MVDFAKLFEKEAEEDAALKNYAARLPVYGIDPETGFTNYTNPVVPELKLPVQGIHDTYVPSRYDVAGPVRFLPAVHEGAGNVRAIMNEGFETPENIAAKVFGPIGGNDVERVQTWPEKMVRSGASLPTDVMAGRVLSGPGLRATDYSDIPGAPQPLSNLIERTQDLAGLAAGGSVAATGLKAEKPGILARGAKTLKDRLTQSLLEDSEAGTGISSLAQRMNEMNRGNESMPEILARQRASEGYEAAIRDPETKKLYTGMWHEEVLDKIAKDKGIPKDQLPTNLVKGYINDRDQFLSEAALERRQQARANSKTAMFRSDDIVGTGLAAVQAPRFYSHMENVINDAKMMVRDKEGKRVEVPQEKFNSNELNAYLKNKGVSNEEIEALKIPEFLEGKKSVTKQELLNHLNENKVELNERWSGIDPKFKKWYDENWNKRGDTAFETLPHYTKKDIIKDYQKDFPGADTSALEVAPRFAQYQLADGSNYRELLLSLKDNPSKVKRIEEINKELDQIRKEMKANRNEVPEFKTKKELENYIENFTNSDKYKEFETRKEALASELADLGNSFTTDHWPGNKDVFVHSRMNNRFIPDESGPVAVNGQKGYNTLHAEEIQSDLHQKGNSEGYRLSLKEKNKLEPEFNRIEEKIVNSGDESVMSHPEIRDAIKMAVDKKIITEAEAKTYLRYADSERYGAVKDAPFKSTWSDVMIKRLIRQAAEENKDAISWTPGQAQIDRYPGLVKNIHEIEYTKNKDGKYELNLIAKDGEGAPTPKKYYNADELHTIVGKEADRIIKGEGKKLGDNSYRLTNINDLKIGGEFHKKFYDEIMVNKVNAIVKKYGARVEEREIGLTEKDVQKLRDLKTIDNPQKFELEEIKRLEQGQKIWFLKLTPELKKAALEKGFSLFETGLPLTPVDHDPWQNKKKSVRLVPVDHDPWRR